MESEPREEPPAAKAEAQPPEAPTADAPAAEAPPADAPAAEAPAAEAPAAEVPAAAIEAPKKPAQGRVRRAYAWMREHYFRMDPRTAGLFRIVVGFLCSADIIRHWWYARVFYSNDGVLSNHWHLYRPSSDYNFSIFHAFSSLGEVHVAFALALFCHLCLLVGWHSRLFAVLTFMIVTSLDNRLVMVENGGYVVVNLVTLYTCFLPIERRFSVDALLRSFRERKEKSAADLGTRYLPAWATEDFVSFGVFLVVLNLAVVYFFNVVNKSGDVWRFGETVHDVLYLNRMVTGVAVFFRKILPIQATRILTWSVLCVEGLLPAWILWPYGRRVTRTLALFGVWGLHIAFGSMFRLGPFSWFMMGWSFTLLTREQWALLDAFYRRRAAPRTVVYDAASPVAFAVMRLLSLLDGMGLLRFEEAPPAEPGAPAPPLFFAHDEAGRVSFTGRAALRQIAQALPGGKYAYPVIRLLSLGLDGALFDFVSARREGVARFFGLTIPPSGKERPDAPSPMVLAARRVRGGLREAVLVFLAVCFVFQAVLENKSIPQPIRDRIAQPGFIKEPGDHPQLYRVLRAVGEPVWAAMHATIGYPRLYQGWGMFAPNPITDDGAIAVDGRTIDGRRIDPFSGKEPALDLTIVDGLGLGQIPQDYFNRIRLDRNTVFRQGLSDYLKAWHLHTGRPEDELVAFDVYWVRAQVPTPCRIAYVNVRGTFAPMPVVRKLPEIVGVDYVHAACPKPEDAKMHANELVAIATWRKPGYQPPPGQPPIPPSPKLESAETKQPPDPPPNDDWRFHLPLPFFFK